VEQEFDVFSNKSKETLTKYFVGFFAVIKFVLNKGRGNIFYSVTIDCVGSINV